MEPDERKAAITALGFVTVFTGIDVVSDLLSGATLLHILMEIIVICVTLSVCGFLLWRFLATLHAELRDSEAHSEEYRLDAEKWRKEASHLVEGLSQAIDDQLTQWGLTGSEKEVALLLLKGLSQKEISSVRDVRERTIRQQSLAVYRKGKLAGRRELAAYFLEDLLVPAN